MARAPQMAIALTNRARALVETCGIRGSLVELFSARSRTRAAHSAVGPGMAGTLGWAAAGAAPQPGAWAVGAGGCGAGAGEGEAPRSAGGVVGGEAGAAGGCGSGRGSTGCRGSGSRLSGRLRSGR